MLGTRETDVYGDQTLADIDAQLRRGRAGLEVERASRTTEATSSRRCSAGAPSAPRRVDQPGRVRTSVAIRDAIARSTSRSSGHLNIYKREKFPAQISSRRRRGRTDQRIRAE
jgi:3-dehydroquinate dehydratase